MPRSRASPISSRRATASSAPMLGTATAPSSSNGAVSHRDVPAASANWSTVTAPPTTTTVISTSVVSAPRRLQAPRRTRLT